MHSRLLLTTLLITTTFLASAQLTFGIKAGYVTSTAKLTKGFSSATFTSKQGTQAGLTSSAIISKKFSLMTSLLYTQKGFIETNGSLGSLGHTVFDRRINYLELPVDLVWHTPIKANSRFFVGTGLVPAIGISDKMKYAIDFSGRPSDAGTTHMGFGKDAYYKSFDLGWNILGGVEFKNIGLTADYNLGLTSLTHDGFDQTLLKNRMLAITASYFFRKKNLHQ